MVKLGQRLVRGFVYGMLVGVITTILATVGGAVLAKLGFSDIPTSVWSAIGFLFGFAAPVAIEISKDIEYSEKSG